MEKNSIDIKEVSGDIIGVGIDGSGNIIGKDISIVINQAQSYGINLLTSDYFKEYKSTDQDLEDWKNGFSFKLEAIKDKKDFRRNIVANIKAKLESEHRLLIVGESGTSKSTILMEIMCDYFEEGYKILYNFGESEIKNGIDLVKFIEGFLKCGNKVLVAVDNTHSERTAAIFYLIDQLSNYEHSKNLRFVLTARLPDFDWFVNDRLNKVEEEAYRQSIRKIIQDNGIRYEVEAFTKDETEQFIRKYREAMPADKVFELATSIFDNTKGHPIMVKFYVLGKGLGEDVKERYYRYLTDPMSMQPDPIKIQTMIICSLLDIANLPITDKLLESMGVLSYAYELEKATLHQYSEQSWSTIHLRWDTELLSFLYNEKNKGILIRRKEYLKKSIDSILNVNDEDISASIIQMVYDIASAKTIPIAIAESAIQAMPDYLNNKTKCNLYIHAMASAYRRLRMPKEMIEKCDRALEIDLNNTDALNNKAWALYELKKYEESLECCNKALKVDPNDIDAWTHKGWALQELKKYDEAIECWNKSIQIDDNNNHVNEWNKDTQTIIHHNLKGRSETAIFNRIFAEKLINKGTAYNFLKKYDLAIECFNKALEIDPKNGVLWNKKGFALGNLGKYEEAIECYNKALEIDDKDVLALFQKGFSLNTLGRYDEAIECFNKALEIDPKNVNALNDKSFALNNLGRYDEAIECCNKALEIDPKNGVMWIWIHKGFALNNLGKGDEAIEYFNKALEIDPKNVDAWINRSNALIRLGKYEEAIECCNRILEKDANYALAWYNRACAKVRNGQIESGINDLEKAVEIGKDYYVEMAKRDSDFESIRDEERFKAVLSKNTL
jgi:tetratricopeptide (TPR) repeat protein